MNTTDVEVRAYGVDSDPAISSALRRAQATLERFANGEASDADVEDAERAVRDALAEYLPVEERGPVSVLDRLNFWTVAVGSDEEA